MFNYKLNAHFFMNKKNKQYRKNPPGLFQCAQCCEIFWTQNENKICLDPLGLLISDMTAKYLGSILVVHKSTISSN